MKTDWKDKKVLILGLSVSGKAAARYLAKEGANVYITEMREEKPEDKAQIEELNALGIKIEMGGHSEEFLSNLYLAVTSPSVPLDSELYLRLKNSGVKIISEVSLAYLESDKPFIAITGTNGKTTTTSLVSHILSTEYKAPACGNIGIPPCSLLDTELDYFVCEMSSFQIVHSVPFKSKIACWTNYTPDHITWHGSVEKYFEAKAQLFIEPQTPEYAIFNAKDEKLLEFSKTCNSKVFLFDVEQEQNGLYYYNRTPKFDDETIAKLKSAMTKQAEIEK